MIVRSEGFQVYVICDVPRCVASHSAPDAPDLPDGWRTLEVTPLQGSTFTVGVACPRCMDEIRERAER